MDRLIAYVALALLSFFLGMQWQTYTTKVNELNAIHETGGNQACGSSRAV